MLPATPPLVLWRQIYACVPATKGCLSLTRTERAHPELHQEGE